MSGVRLAAFGTSPSAATVAAAVADALLIPDTSAIRSACSVAIIAATTNPGGSIREMLAQETIGPYGSLYELMNPGGINNLDPIRSGALSGSTSYQIAAAPGSGRTAVYGWSVTASVKTTLTWYSGAAAPMTDGHEVAPGVPWDISPGSRESLRTNTEDPLVLRSSNAAAVLNVTCWQRTVTG